MAVAEGVAVAVRVGDGVSVGVTVGVAVAVAVAVGVVVGVGVSVGVGVLWQVHWVRAEACESSGSMKDLGDPACEEAGVAEEPTPVAPVCATRALESLSREHPGMLPSSSSFSTQKSFSPSPKDSVPPATKYPP